MRSVVIASLLAVIGCVSTADAWWCTGHMTIAQIAKDTMSSQAVTKVEAILQNLESEGPFPQSADMVQAACWADDLKSDGLYPMASWHFINRPYAPNNFVVNGNPIQEENVETVIMQLDKAAKRNRSGKKWILQFAVANLIHFYGDIHQPLHVTELFSTIYPNGDKGGNEQQVTVDGQTTKLHFIWDSICWEFTSELVRPLSATDYKVVTDLATQLQATYTFTPSQKKEFNATVMAMEGYNDAISTAYPGTHNGMTITPAYLAKCKPVAESRVALAGYRLGNQLEYMFGAYGHDLTLLTHKIHEHIAIAHVELRNQMARDSRKH